MNVRFFIKQIPVRVQISSAATKIPRKFRGIFTYFQVLNCLVCFFHFCRMDRNRIITCFGSILTHHHQCFFEPDNTNSIHKFHDMESWIDLKPFTCEIGIGAFFMVVILEQFTQQENTPWLRIFGMVAILIILITLFVATPVYNGALYRTHQEMDRQ